MNAKIRYEINDTDRIRPHIRLCHLILSEALASGFTAVELAATSGSPQQARAQIEGAWKPFMAFPVSVYDALVEHFKQMAGADGTILVQLAGRDASVTLRVRRNAQGSDDLVLSFPTNTSSGLPSN